MLITTELDYKLLNGYLAITFVMPSSQLERFTPKIFFIFEQSRTEYAGLDAND